MRRGVRGGVRLMIRKLIKSAPTATHTAALQTQEHEKTARRRFDVLGDYLAGGGSGSKQASATCRPLSRAKFITKSQAMTS